LQALDERRLVVEVNTKGIVQAVLSTSTPGSLFGFEPHRLMGRSLGEVVDVLHLEGGCRICIMTVASAQYWQCQWQSRPCHLCAAPVAGKGANMTEEDALLAGTQDSLLAQVLLELAAQSMEHAGMSW
jgi:hypothetical protein